MADKTEFTIESYLRGRVPKYEITDEAMMSALVDGGVEPGTNALDTTEKQRDLALSAIYIGLATAPTRTETVKDSDGRWSHEEGGEQNSALVQNRLLAMANELRKKWGLEAVASSQWGFSGGGFHDVRDYGGLHYGG